MKYTDPNPINEGPCKRGQPWISITIHVDERTGEVLGNDYDPTDYDKIKKQEHFYAWKQWNVREIIWLCRPAIQYPLEYESDN